MTKKKDTPVCEMCAHYFYDHYESEKKECWCDKLDGVLDLVETKRVKDCNKVRAREDLCGLYGRWYKLKTFS